MNASEKPTFYFHADASAVGGYLEQPLDRIITSPASVSLAQAGGFSRASVEKFDLEGLITAEAVHAHVSGSEHAGVGYRSTATAIVEGLNILEVVTADRVVAQVSIMHPHDGRPAEVSLFGSKFVNLEVNGVPVEPVYDRRLFGAGRVKTEENVESHAPSLAELISIAELQYVQQTTERKLLVDTLGRRFDLVNPRLDLAEKGSALCSLVESVTVEEPILGYGRVIHVPDFGNIFLGELCVSYFSAELTMVRVELGCTSKGSVSAGSARSNGRTMP